MALTPKGFDGTVTEQDFAKMARHFGTPYSVKDKDDFKVTTVTGQDRMLAIATGEASAYGVTVTNDATINVQLPTIASGSRWDLICLRRDWQPAGGTATVTYVQGTSSQALPAARNANPGVIDDQPLALVQVTAGNTLPTAVIDLRSFASKVITCADVLALPDAPLGTQAIVAGVEYRRELDGSNNLTWVSYPKDSGFLSNILNVATGYSIDIQSARKIGNVAQINFTITRTGTTISSTADGDIGNSTMATITDAAWKPLLTTAVAHNGVGVIAGMSLNTAGSLQVSALLPNISLATNDRLSGSLTYLVA